MDLIDQTIRQLAGPEPYFDPVMCDFLNNIKLELTQRIRPGCLLDAAVLGEKPWLWRLRFATRGLVREEDGSLHAVEQHTVAVRFLPDYLRRADRFEILSLIEPKNAFHPNLREALICLEVYPGQPLVDICESLHALFSWRLRQLSETDALNPDACAWGRAHLDELPLDRRPLFGRTLRITLEPAGTGG
jgi:hypothetical protein